MPDRRATDSIAASQSRPLLVTGSEPSVHCPSLHSMLIDGGTDSVNATMR